jgi:hypothetical protein
MARPPRRYVAALPGFLALRLRTGVLAIAQARVRLEPAATEPARP